MKSVPPDSKPEFTTLVDESKVVAKASLQAALDMGVAVARTFVICCSHVKKLLATSLRSPS